MDDKKSFFQTIPFSFLRGSTILYLSINHSLNENELFSIMENAANHNVDRCLTTATRKADMQPWLNRHHIEYGRAKAVDTAHVGRVA